MMTDISKNYTGNNISIAVLDSGIKKGELKLNFKTIENGFKNHFNSFTDKINHGTPIAHLIQSVVPDARIINVKIFDDKDKTSTKVILDSLKWCFDNKVNIICLSTSILDLNCYTPIKKLCDKALQLNIFIICSYHNLGIPCLPAGLDNVIGVNSAILPDNYSFFSNPDNDTEIFAKGFKIPVCDSYNNSIYVNGNSFATALVTGITALFLEHDPKMNFKKLKEYFKINSSSCNHKPILKRKKIAFFNKDLPLIDTVNKFINGKIENAIIYIENIYNYVLLTKYKENIKLKKYVVVCSTNKYIFQKIKNNSVKKMIPLCDYMYEDLNIAIENNKDIKNLLLLNIDQVKSKKIMHAYSDKIDTICSWDVSETNKIRKNYISNYIYQLYACLSSYNKKIVFYNSIPTISIINLSTVQEYSCEVQIKTSGIFKELGYKTGNISNSQMFTVFGVDYIINNSIISGLTEKKRALFYKLVLQYFESNNYDIIIHAISGGFKLFTVDAYDNIFNLINMFCLKPDIFILLIDEYTKEEEVQKNFTFYNDLLGAECLLFFYLDINDLLEIQNTNFLTNKNKVLKIEFLKQNYTYPIYSNLEEMKLGIKKQVKKIIKGSPVNDH